jgi:hypothetical protein
MDICAARHARKLEKENSDLRKSLRQHAIGQTRWLTRGDDPDSIKQK